MSVRVCIFGTKLCLWVGVLKVGLSVRISPWLPSPLLASVCTRIFLQPVHLLGFPPHLPSQVVFTRLGVALAMVFVSFPFVVRTMQPVIQVRSRHGFLSMQSFCRHACARMRMRSTGNPKRPGQEESNECLLSTLAWNGHPSTCAYIHFLPTGDASGARGSCLDAGCLSLADIHRCECLRDPAIPYTSSQ